LWVTDRVTPLRMFAGHLSDVDVSLRRLLVRHSTDPFQCLKFHPNSLYLATGSSDKTCRLWDVQRGECVRVFLGHNDAVDCLAISPNGRYLASACTFFSSSLLHALTRNSDSARPDDQALGHVTRPRNQNDERPYSAYYITFLQLGVIYAR
jgi:WD40 repeat protein